MERECFTGIGRHSNGRKEDENWEREKNRTPVVGWVERVMRILKMNEKVQELSVERTENAAG